MLLLLSVVCQAQPWTGSYVGLEQNTAFQEQDFYINNDRRTLPDTPSDTIETDDYARLASLPDNKRNKPFGNEVKTTIIELISWQWLHATKLLVAYELILTTINNPLNSSPYSWVPVEVVVVVGWLLKNCWNPDSPLFDPIEQQTTSMLTQEDYLSEILITMYGYGQNLPQCQLSEASGQQAPQTTNPPKDSLTNPLYSGNGGGNGCPEQLSHTLGLNCFVHPCNGVCRFRPLPDGKRPPEWTLNYQQISSNHTGPHPGQGLHPHFANGHNPSQRQTHQPNDATTLKHLPVSSDDLVIINGLLNLHNQRCPEESEISFTLTHMTSRAGISKTQQTVAHSYQLDQSSSHISRTDTVQVINNNGQLACDLTIVDKNSQPKPCRKICKNVNALSVHKSKFHTGQKACYVMVVGEDGQQQPCRKICKHASALTDHKRRDHTGQQICGATVILEDGRPRLCGMVCNNVEALSSHKRRHHTGQQTCDVTVIGEGGQQRSCGKVCNNNGALADHKYKYHGGQQTCDVTEIGEDGLQRRCATVWKNPNSLRNHKRRKHTLKKSCDVTVTGENGKQQPCRKLFKNANAPSSHKNRDHSRQQTCDLTVTRENGQQPACGKLCDNAHALSIHKRIHRKRKPVDADQPQSSKKQSE
ncbi:hypothetical protein [Endozoicomonas sp. 8E]|uniref:hypothetical protein n=1 Tax=Endozoicomonas sp. 8E TaxID=3035692 RepID=UPI0029394AC6|nr:hypothetical protein [Endozoicomonas sp. 8E]WOG27031.1 hypothetical protein P6910_21140 [Endozoicomonas sp. 8E]